MMAYSARYCYFAFWLTACFSINGCVPTHSSVPHSTERTVKPSPANTFLGTMESIIVDGEPFDLENVPETPRSINIVVRLVPGEIAKFRGVRKF